MRRCVVVFVVAAVLVHPVFVPSVKAASVEDVRGELRSPGPLELDGTTGLVTQSGVLHLRSLTAGNGFGIALGAERLDIHYTWNEGYQPTSPEGLPIPFRVMNSTGEKTVTLFGVRAGARSGPEEVTEILAVVDHATSGMAAEARGNAAVRVIEQHYLTQVEWRGDDPTVGIPEHGFWYLVGPGLRSSGFDDATVSGNFTLFVNNVTLAGSTTEGNWSHWTGFREEEVAPNVNHVESRVTVIQVTNGTLWLSAPNLLSVYATREDIRSGGSVSAPAAHGELHTPARMLLFREAALIMSGSGSTKIEYQASEGTGGGFYDLPGGAELLIVPSGRFIVEETPGLIVQTQAVQGRDVPSSLLAWAPWLGLLLVVGFVAARSHDVALARVARWRARRRLGQEYRWLSTGDRLQEAREYEQALWWFQKIVRKYPNSTHGWTSSAYMFELLERWSEASQAFERLHRLMLNPEGIMLASAAECAWRAGEQERAVTLALEVVGMNPDVARRRRREEPEVRALWELPGVRAALGDEGGGASYV